MSVKSRKSVAAIALSLLSTVADAGEAVESRVFARFNNEISILERKLVKESNPNRRFGLFLHTYRRLAELRSRNSRSSEIQEIDMSLFMETLSYLPSRETFIAEQCPAYQSYARTMMMAYDGSTEVFVERALKVVDLICH